MAASPPSADAASCLVTGRWAGTTHFVFKEQEELPFVEICFENEPFVLFEEEPDPGFEAHEHVLAKNPLRPVGGTINFSPDSLKMTFLGDLLRVKEFFTFELNMGSKREGHLSFSCIPAVPGADASTLIDISVHVVSLQKRASAPFLPL